MVYTSAVTEKEVLAWLTRAGKIADRALASLNEGNPYDGIRLVRTVAELDVRAIAVLSSVKDYDTHLKPFREELVNECSAILGTAQTVLKAFSSELESWPAEKRSQYGAMFQGLLRDLDEELNAEKNVAKNLSEAERAFYSEKAWTYARQHLESAMSTLNNLVQDEKAMQKTIQRLSGMFRKGVKHANPGQFMQDLLKRRVRAREVVKIMLDNAFRSAFTFKGHDWRAEIVKISELPKHNVVELEAFREQLLKASVFVKRNVDYASVRELMGRIKGLGERTRSLEYTIEKVQAYMKENSKSDEEIMKEHWEARIRHGFVYHGTSSVFLPNIERFGLSSERIFSEGTPFRPEDYSFFLEVFGKVDAGALKYFTEDVARGFFLESNYRNAVGYARQGPERIRFMLEHIKGIENDFRRGAFKGAVSAQEVSRLLEILARYEAAMSHHKPVVLHIPMGSPALLDVMHKNGLEAAAEWIANYGAYRQLVLQQLNSARTGGGNPDLAVPGARLIEILKSFDPLQQVFHNRPLKGTLPWSVVAKAEYV